MVQCTCVICGWTDIQIVDWDWADQYGKASYPYFLNWKIKWPPGVFDGKKIEYNHDQYWVNHFVKGLLDNDAITFASLSTATTTTTTAPLTPQT
jgi:hypothetical protein